MNEKSKNNQSANQKTNPPKAFQFSMPDVNDMAKALWQQPAIKVMVIGIGLIGVGYGVIVLLRMSTQLITAIKDLDTAVNS